MSQDYTLATLDWCKAKIVLQDKSSKTLFKEGEVWWCSIGMNVGVEIYGKGEKFIRPVLVFKKFNSESFLGIPIASKTKTGSLYAPVQVEGKNGTAMLAQARALDTRRLIARMEAMGSGDFSRIRGLFAELYVSENVHPAPSEAGISGFPQQ